MKLTTPNLVGMQHLGLINSGFRLWPSKIIVTLLKPVRCGQQKCPCAKQDRDLDNDDGMPGFESKIELKIPGYEKV